MNSTIQIKKLNQFTGHTGAVYSLKKGKNPHTFLSTGGDGRVIEWSVLQPDQGKLIAKSEQTIFSMEYLAKNNQLLVGNMEGGLHWINLSHPSKNKNIAHHQKGIFDIQYYNQQIYTIGGDGKLTIWDEQQQRTLETIKISHHNLRKMAINPTTKELAIGSSDHSIAILDLETLDIKQQIHGAHKNSVFTLCYSPDGRFLWSGGRDAKINIRDAKNTYPLIAEIDAHLFTVNTLAFQESGGLLASGSRDKTIKIWDPETFELLKVIDILKYKAHVNSVNALLWISNTELLTAGDDRKIFHWEIIRNN